MFRENVQKGNETGEAIGRRRIPLDVWTARVEFDGYPRVPGGMFRTQVSNGHDHLAERVWVRLRDADDEGFRRRGVPFEEGSHPCYIGRQGMR